jgi:hypothetical protein
VREAGYGLVSVAIQICAVDHSRWVVHKVLVDVFESSSSSIAAQICTTQLPERPFVVNEIVSNGLLLVERKRATAEA